MPDIIIDFVQKDTVNIDFQNAVLLPFWWTTWQSLIKKSNGDNDVEWHTLTANHISDINTYTGTLTNKTMDDYSNYIHANWIHIRVKMLENLNKWDVIMFVWFNNWEQAIEARKRNSLTVPAIWIMYTSWLTWDFWLALSNWLLKWINTSSFPEWTILYPNSSWGFTTTPNISDSHYNQQLAYVVRQHAVNWEIMINVWPWHDISNQVAYDNTISWLTATNVKTALDELSSEKVNNFWNETIGWIKTFTDILLLPNSNPTLDNQAVRKAYVDSLVVWLLDDRWNYDASSNLFPSTWWSWASWVILKWDLWFIAVAWILWWTQVNIWDQIRALVDNPWQISSNWWISEAKIWYTPENQANKENTTIDSNTTKYPTVNLLRLWLLTKQDTLVSWVNIKTINWASVVWNWDLIVGWWDMMKSVYDTNNNWKVDISENAEKLQNTTLSQIYEQSLINSLIFW